MNFRTELKLNFADDLINYKSKILTIGSCFADEMGAHLKEYEFNVVNNPFGILFNPVSIFDVIDSSMNEKINEDLFVERNGQWFHFDYHSSITALSKEELKSKICELQQQTKLNLLNSDVLIVTLGTAWVYKHIKSNQYVANCHKVAQSEFQKELMHLESLKNWCQTFFTQLFEKNKKLKVILTVSPVRHIKDGLHENNLSKSVLHLLSNQLKNNFENIIYFPAYELIIDDLRDYRFYKEDMIHPTIQAIEYVFDKFSDCYFSEKTKTIVGLKKDLINLENHRLIVADTVITQLHKEKIDKKRVEFNSLKETQIV